jgi:phenylacetate-CoA ligase
MSAIRGRTDDMLIIRGVNVFPTQVEAVLGRFPELAPHYQLAVGREGTLDTVEVRAELTEDSFRTVGSELPAGDGSEGGGALQALRDRVSRLIKDSIGCSMAVTVVAPGSLPRSEGGKLSRVIDDRPAGEG